ncbi:MAG: hypothetical protein CMM03_08315 [Rhodopirellula sp.]|nr:hypothetical protein [Rhodopirellula sp.]
MHTLDIITVVVYLLFIISLGVYFGRDQDRKEFFVAGGSMGWLTVGLSVMATLFSSNSFVFYPSAALGDSLKIGLSLVAFALMTPVVIKIFIPVYARLRVETAYEYLEKRYDVKVRSLASGLFILLRIGWMASATYAASVVVRQVSGIDETVIIIGLGIISIGYTMLGGLRAVMWTDVIQFFIFALTILAALLLILSKSNATVAEIVSNYFDGRSGTIVDFELSMSLKYGSWAILIGVFLESVSAFGVDQVAVQRYLAGSDERNIKRGAWLNLAGMWIVIPGLLAIGVGLYTYFGNNPLELASVVESPEAVEKLETLSLPTIQQIVEAEPKAADRAMPEFVRVHFPPGLAGLFLAALMAAIMSSIDSGIHSVTTAVVVDFRDRLLPSRKPRSEREELTFIRFTLVVVGVFAVGLACMVGNMGDVFDIGKKLTAAFGGPLLAVFLLALFDKRSNSLGVLISALTATVCTLMLMYTQEAWFSVWYWPIGFGGALILGLGVSRLFPEIPTQFTYRQIVTQSNDRSLDEISRNDSV